MQLTEIDGADLVGKIPMAHTSSNDLQKSLSQIQWTRNEVKVQNSFRVRNSSKVLGCWSWKEENPHRNFYESGNEFQTDISFFRKKD